MAIIQRLCFLPLCAISQTLHVFNIKSYRWSSSELTMPPSEALPQVSKFTLFRTELFQIWIPGVSHLPFLLIAPKAWVRVKVSSFILVGAKDIKTFLLGFMQPVAYQELERVFLP